MAEEIDVENGRNSNFEGVVTLTLTFDPSIRHTVVHHSSTSTYIPNLIQIEETFCGRTDVRTYGRTFFPSIQLGRLSEKIIIIIIIRQLIRRRNMSIKSLQGLTCCKLHDSFQPVYVMLAAIINVTVSFMLAYK